MASSTHLFMCLILSHLCIGQKISVQIGDSTHDPTVRDVYFVELELYNVTNNSWCGDYITNMQLYRNNQWSNARQFNAPYQFTFPAADTGGGIYSPPITSRMLTACGSTTQFLPLNSLTKGTTITSTFQLCDDQPSICITPSPTTLTTSIPTTSAPTTSTPTTYDPTSAPTTVPPTHSPSSNPSTTSQDLDEYSVIIDISNGQQLTAQEVDNIVGDILSLDSNINGVNIESVDVDTITLTVTSNDELDTDKIEQDIVDGLADEYPDITVSVEKKNDNNVNNDSDIIVIVCIVIILILLLCIVALSYVIWKRKKRKRKENMDKMETTMHTDAYDKNETEMVNDKNGTLADMVADEMPQTNTIAKRVYDSEGTDETESDDGEELYTSPVSDDDINILENEPETAGNIVNVGNTKGFQPNVDIVTDDGNVDREFN